MVDVGTLTTIVTSAAVGTFVGALSQFFGAYLERRSRRRELLLSQALALAKARDELAWKFAERGEGVGFRDQVMHVETYYQWLAHLLAHDRLPEEAHRLERWSRRIQKKRMRGFE